MALKVELDRHLLLQALEWQLASSKRAKNTTKEPQFVPIIEATINKWMVAIASVEDLNKTAK